MSKIIEYGDRKKILSPFFGQYSIIQQFSMDNKKMLQKIFLYIHLNEKKEHSLVVKLIITDQQENIYVVKQIDMSNILTSDYLQIPIGIKLDPQKNYFLCLDSYGQGDTNNNISFCVGYRKKMMNFFINNKFSLGQLCFKIKVK